MTKQPVPQLIDFLPIVGHLQLQILKNLSILIILFLQYLLVPIDLLIQCLDNIFCMDVLIVLTTHLLDMFTKFLVLLNELFSRELLLILGLFLGLDIVLQLTDLHLQT